MNAKGQSAKEAEVRADLRRHGRVRMTAVTCSLGEVLDISASGIRMLCGGRPDCRVGRRITITVTTENDVFGVVMRPVWIRKVGFFKYELGGCFEDLDESTRMRLIGLARSAVTHVADKTLPE